MTPAPYLRPAALDEALAALAGGRWAILAGGTDFYPARVGREVDEAVLDITRIGELRGIACGADGVRIGAATTWTELIAADLPRVFDGLKAAAREVGGRQVQNAGTVAGNLCNASPAADGVPPLLALDAEVELVSQAGMRRLPLAQFVLGSRRTAREAAELVAAIHVPVWGPRARSVFLKLGHRRYLVISIAMVAVTLDLDDGGRIARCAVAVGACSAAARRIAVLETRIVGMTPAQAAAAVTPADLEVLTPIDDVRGSADYRREAVRVLLQRAILAAGAA